MCRAHLFCSQPPQHFCFAHRPLCHIDIAHPVSTCALVHHLRVRNIPPSQYILPELYYFCFIESESERRQPPVWLVPCTCLLIVITLTFLPSRTQADVPKHTEEGLSGDQEEPRQLLAKLLRRTLTLQLTLLQPGQQREPKPVCHVPAVTLPEHICARQSGGQDGRHCSL